MKPREASEYGTFQALLHSKARSATCEHPCYLRLDVLHPLAICYKDFFCPWTNAYYQVASPVTRPFASLTCL